MVETSHTSIDMLHHIAIDKIQKIRGNICPDDYLSWELRQYIWSAVVYEETNVSSSCYFESLCSA